MKKGNYCFALLALFSTALLLFACEPTTTTSPPDAAKDIEAVKAVIKKIETDWNTGKPDGAYLTSYAENCVIMPPGMENILSKEIEKKRSDTLFAAYTITWTVDTFDDVQISGDLAVVRYSATDKATPKKGGETTILHSKAVYVLKRQGDGSWKVIIDIWNFN